MMDAQSKVKRLMDEAFEQQHLSMNVVLNYTQILCMVSLVKSCRYVGIISEAAGHSIPGSLVGSGSSAATLTVHMYILSNEGLHVNEAFASAVVLLALTFLINLVSDLIERRIAKKKG